MPPVCLKLFVLGPLLIAAGDVSLRSQSFHRPCQKNGRHPAMPVKYLKAKQWKE